MSHNEFDMEQDFLEPVGYFMQTNQIELSVGKRRIAAASNRQGSHVEDECATELFLRLNKLRN